jgi:hypothetical protein
MTQEYPFNQSNPFGRSGKWLWYKRSGEVSKEYATYTEAQMDLADYLAFGENHDEWRALNP